MEAFHLANSLFVREEYELAVKHYTDALTDHVPESLRNRGLAYYKLGELGKARADLDQSLSCCQVEKTDEIQFVQNKLGEVNFHLRDFRAARTLFEATGNKLWLRKCEAESSASVLPLTGYLPKTTAPVAAPASISAGTTAPSSKLCGDSTTTTSAGPSSSEPPVLTLSAAAAAASNGDGEGTAKPSAGATDDDILVEEVEPPKKPIRHEWYQNDNFVVLSVYLKQLSPENLQLDLSERRVFLRNMRSEQDPLFVKESGFQKTLDIDLFDDIVCEESNVEHGKVGKF